MRHFEQELEELRDRLLEMSALVESSIFRSVSLLTDFDQARADEIVQREQRINQMEVEIDEMATRLLALEQPVAVDLRLITSAIKINNDLERMADLAVNIVEWGDELRKGPPLRTLVDVPLMSQLVESMVHKAIDAFVNRDATAARNVLTSDDAVDDTRDHIYSTVIELMEKDSTLVRPGVALMFIARNLERMADHATNIAEDILFLLEGVDVRHHAEV